MPSYTREDVDLTAAPPSGVVVAAPGRVVSAVYFPTIPGGLANVSVRYGSNPAFIPVVAGDFFDLECDEEDEGVFVTFSPPLPGSFLPVFVFGTPTKVNG